MNVFFKALYSMLILSIFLVGQIPLPIGLNLVQTLSILMLLYCVFYERRLLCDNVIVLYLIFLFFYALSALATGYFSNFLAMVRSHLIVGYTAYWASKILVKKNESVSLFIIPLMIAGILDSTATIMQANGIPIRNPFMSLIMSDVSNQDELLAAHGFELGYSICGLFENPVFNGHSLLLFFVCSLYYLFSRKWLWRMFGIGTSLIILIGLFFCQQRGAFIISIMALCIVLYKLFGNLVNSKLIGLILFSIVLAFFFPRIFDFINGTDSRLNSFDASSRSVLWENSIKYYFENPIIGGYHKASREVGAPSHNIIISAFLAGGFFGGCILLILISKLLSCSYQLLKTDNASIIFSLLFISLLGNSLLHNTGLVEGDPATIVSCSFLFYNYHKNISTCSKI